MPRPLFRWLVLIALVFAADLKAASSSISLGASPNPATYGSAVTLTATVSPPDATGKVTFYDGVSVLGIASVSSGTASLVTRTLPSGARSLKAYYSGDGSYSPSTSTPWIENVHTVSGKGFVLGQPAAIGGSMVAAGDFNEDGKLDLVASSGSRVAVALGNGDGTFGTPAIYTAGLDPKGPAVGDFNGDGKLDVAVADDFGTVVYILLGVGDGSFGAPVQYTVPVQGGGTCAAQSVAIGDFNRDGKIDLAVATGCSVGILLGVGDGSFAMGQSYQGGSGTQQTLIQDLDGDGIADLISLGNNGSSATLLGHGDGTFGTVQFANFSSPAIASDFDGDGKIDVVVTGPYPNNVLVLPGNGDGTFGDVVTSTASTLTGRNLAVEDFNADGRADLVGGGLNDIGFTLEVLFGIGDGTFQEAFPGPAFNYSNQSFIVADFNGDGRPDVATSNLVVLLGAPDTGLDLTKSHSGNFHQGQTGATYSIGVKNLGPQATSDVVTMTDTLPVSLTATSIAGAGWNCTLVGLTCTRNDALAANASYPPITVTVNVATWAPPKVLNTATVAFGTAAYPPPDDYANDPTVILAGQLISFGPLPNRALANSPFPVTATSSSGLPVTFSASGNCSVAQATVTLTGAGNCSITASQAGDGTYPPAPDVVNSFTIFSTASSVGLVSSRNPSRFDTPITLTATVTPANATGTVTFYDGTTVLGIKNLSGGSAAITLKFLPTGGRSLHAYYGGDGNYPGSSSGMLIQSVRSLVSPGLFAAHTEPAERLQSDDVATGDFNGDGRLDIVTTNVITNVDVRNDTLVVLLNNGDGTYTTLTSTVSLKSVTSIRVGDLNGDGKADLVIADNALGVSTSKIIVLLGNGDGTFTVSQVYAADPESLELADFNEDGKLDIVYIRYWAERFIVLAGNGDGTFSQAGDFAANHAGISVAVGDFNGDGHADVVTSSASGGVDVFLGRGDFTFGPPITFSTGQTPFSIAVGDLNGDGKPDLATANASSISILLNNGNGTFAAPIVYAISSVFPEYLAIADFSGDGRLDLAIGGYPLSNPNILLYLGNGDGTLVPWSTYKVDPFPTPPVLTVGDFNGDGRVDLVAAGLQITTFLGIATPSKVGVFRTSFYVTAEDANGNIAWDAGTDRTGNFGAPGDQIIFGDWDGSGTTKIGLFRPSNGLMALDMNGNLQYDPGIDKIGIFGQPGDVAIVGDWSGDGKTKVGIYRPSTSYFALDTNGDLKLDAGDTTGTFGAPGDVPIVGDWTGNGKAKVGIFRNGTWALDMNGNILFDSGIDAVGGIGQTGDVPLLGDWNGDGRTKVGIYRASQALFGLDYNGNLTWDASDRAGNYGAVGDTPILGDWDGTGVTRIGIYRAGIWALDVNGNIAWDGGIDRVGGFGVPGDLPIVGKWQ